MTNAGVVTGDSGATGVCAWESIPNVAKRRASRIVFVTARVTREGHNAVASITDNGVGIPQAMLSRVFEMFERVDREPEVTPDGLGIGLTLVRRLVELHGGTVTAQSEGPELRQHFHREAASLAGRQSPAGGARDAHRNARKALPAARSSWSMTIGIRP